MTILRYLITPFFALALLLSAGCSEAEKIADDTQEGATLASYDLYKSPTCGCCEDWMIHMNERGYSAVVHHPDDLNAVKAKLGIHPRYQSCHTAVMRDGHVFEGHIPARYIEAFLENPPPGAIGLAVPGMPVGSPGMEAGARFDPYDVLLLKADGSSEVYARVERADQQ